MEKIIFVIFLNLMVHLKINVHNYPNKCIVFGNGGGGGQKKFVFSERGGGGCTNILQTPVCTLKMLNVA